MPRSWKLRSGGIGATIVLTLALGVRAQAEPAKCQAAIVKASAAFVQAKAEERGEIQAEIGAVAEDRRAYIEARRQESRGANGLDDAISAGIRSAAESKGFAIGE